MTITPVTLNNTFDEWRVKTNQLITQYDQTNQLVVASFNYANSTVSTSANVTANILASNTQVLTIIADATQLALPNILVSNASIRTLIFDNSNNYIDTLNLETAISSNIYFIDAVGSLIAANVTDIIASNASFVIELKNSANSYVDSLNLASTISANTVFANNIANTITSNVTSVLLSNASFVADVKNSANSYVDSLNLLANISSNTEFVNSVAFAVSSNVSNTIIANTIIINTIYDNANSIANAFITSTDVGASFAKSNAAYDLANSAITSVIEDDVDTTRYITFVSANSGTSNTLGVSSSRLAFNPNTGILSVTVLNSTSDISQKTDIIDIVNSVDMVDQMRGVGFTWKNNGTKSYGVIAQEIEKILPELVNEVDGVKSVNYSGIIAFLIEAVKELDARIEKLESK